MSYDIIGDIHGHAEALEALLVKLGYRQTGGCWRHPGRQVIFLGDFIDRGPRQLDTVDIARRMVDGGAALAIMGNHEFNAIAWHTPDPTRADEYLRPHKREGEKNREQHAKFLAEVDGKPDLHREIIDWFLTLPLWLDLPGIRAVHACWHQPLMNHLSPELRDGRFITREVLPKLATPPEDKRELDTPEETPYKAVEAIAKGIEVQLPEGHYFKDKDGHRRTRARTRWWDPQAIDFRTAPLLPESVRSGFPAVPIPAHTRITLEPKPTFFGHYWFKGDPAPLTPHAACLDYSIARGGELAAYRWDGEPTLKAESFVHVGNPHGPEQSR